MKTIFPDYVPNFSCLAGRCPDTCCKDWWIILDEKTLAVYRALPGPLGDAVWQSLVTEDGETRFALTDGHCRLLTEDGLCSIQLALGEDALCETCHAHPRFYEEYGAVRELSLSVSCLAAARLLLEHPKKLTFREENDEEPVTACNELDAQLYFALKTFRKSAIGLAQDRMLPMAQRCAVLLQLASRCQRLLDEKKYTALSALCSRYEDPAYLQHQCRRLKRLLMQPGAFFPCWMVLNNAEHLTKEFPRLLDRAIGAHFEGHFDEAMENRYENLLVYFLFRYALKAVNDGKLLPRIEGCVFHLLAIRQLYALSEEKGPEAFEKTVCLYSKEMEHSEENLALLMRVFSRGTLSLPYLLSLLEEKVCAGYTNS